MKYIASGETPKSRGARSTYLREYLEVTNFNNLVKRNMYPYLRDNPIEREKLKLNGIVAKSLRPKTALDAFAGDGTSTRIFARYADHVIAIEKDKNLINTFLDGGGKRKISLIVNDNLRILPLLAPRSFDLIDLDPFGSCYDQIELCAMLLNETGIFMLSSGEIQRVVRGLKLSRFTEARDYKGRRAVLWAEEVWIPYIIRMLARRGLKAKLIHFFTSPVLVRVVLAAVKTKVDVDLLRTRPTYLGWFHPVSKTIRFDGSEHGS